MRNVAQEQRLRKKKAWNQLALRNKVHFK